jgi:hypothetical protein
VPALTDALAATDVQLRISAVQALARIDDDTARAALTAHARGSLTPTERAYVERALVR